MGKTTLRGEIEVNFNGRSARDEIKKLEETAKVAGEAIAKIPVELQNASNEQYVALKQTVDVTEALIKKISKANIDVDAIMQNLSGTTSRKLKEALTSVKNAMRSLSEDDVNSEKGVKLREQYRALTEQVNKLNSAMNDNKAVTVQLSDAEQQAITRATPAIALRNRQTASLNELKTALTDVNKRISDLSAEEANSASGKKLIAQKKLLTEQINRTNESLGLNTTQVIRNNKALKDQESGITKTMRRLVDYVAVYWTFNQAMSLSKKWIEGNKQLSESLTNVRKVTGLTSEEINRLSESIDAIDTSTAQLELTNLAYDAGKLGIKGVQNVYEFVRAGNQIRVALGADLGEDAIKNLAKLNDVLGITKKMGVERSLLATGSAINELGMNSAASEGYIVDFAQRLGGIAAVSHLAMADLLALGATTDALAQNVEVSATAMNKVIMTMMTDTERVARVAGMSVDELRKQLDVSTMQGLVSVLEGLQSKGGIEEMGDIFKDLGSDGARLKGVIASLVPNVEMLRAQIYISNKGFEEAVSVTNEYNLKQQSLAAILAKTGNRIKESFVNSGMVTTLTQWANSLSDIEKSFRTSHGTVSIFTASVLGLTSAIIVNKTHVTSWVRLLAVLRSSWQSVTGTIKGATLAVRTFLLTPVGALIAIASAVAAIGLYAYRSATYVSTGEKAWRDYNATLKDVKLEVDSTFAALNRVTIAQDKARKSLEGITEGAQDAEQAEKDLRLQTEKRNAVIQEINQKYGQYLSNLLSEKMTAEELADAKERIVIAMREEAAIKGKDRVVKDIREENAQDVTKLSEKAKKELNSATGDKKISQDIMELAERTVIENIGKGLSLRDVAAEFVKSLKSEEFEGAIDKFSGDTFTAVNRYMAILKSSEEEIYNVTKRYDDDISKYTSGRYDLDLKAYSGNLEKELVSMRTEDIQKTIDFWQAKIDAEGEGYADYEKIVKYISNARQAIFERENDTTDKSNLTFWSINQLKEEMKIAQEGVDQLRPDVDNYEQKLKDYKDRIKAAEDELRRRGLIKDKAGRSGTTKDNTLKELRLELKGIETEYNNHIAALRQQFVDGDISETQLNQQTANAERQYYRNRAAAAVEFGVMKKTNNKEVLEEIESVVAASAAKELDIEVKKQQALGALYYQSDPLKKVKEEYTQRFQELEAFGDSEINLTAEQEKRRMELIDTFATDVMNLDNESLRDRLANAELFGSKAYEMSEEHIMALRELYNDYALSSEEAMQKSEERKLKIIEKNQRLILRQYNQSDDKKSIDSGHSALDDEQADLDLSSKYGANSDSYIFGKQQSISQSRIELWKKEIEAKKGHAEETARLNGKIMEEQSKMLDSTMTYYAKMSNTAEQWGSAFGSSMYGVMFDGKKGRQEMAKVLGQMTVDLAANYAKQLINQEAFSKAKLLLKQSEITTDQALNATSIAQTAAKESTETAISASGVAAEGTLQGAKWFAKAIGSLGPILGPVLGALGVGMIASFISSALSKIGSSESVDSSTTDTARGPAAGMLTYATGKYNVTGDDGVNYNASYEPRLRTGVYEKPHFALFGERAPEMVIDGPTTKKLVLNYPGMYNSLMTLARTGSMRTYATGNYPYEQQASDSNNEAIYQMMTTMMSVVAESTAVNATLTNEINKGIGVNMYGSNGLDSSLNRNSKFKKRNRIG